MVIPPRDTLSLHPFITISINNKVFLLLMDINSFDYYPCGKKFDCGPIHDHNCLLYSFLDKQIKLLDLEGKLHN
jgi:hypothetical protein